MGMFQGWLGRQLRRPNGWLAGWVGRYMEKGNQEVNQWTIGLMKVAKGEAILEIGSGNGAAIESICQGTDAGLVCGVDLADEMVRQAARRNRAGLAEGRVEIGRGEAGALPYQASRFDQVFTVHTIYFWEDIEKGFSEIDRVLKPGGRLFVSFMDGAAMAKLERAKDFRLFTPGEVEGLLAQAGFHSFLHHQKGSFWCIEARK